MLYNVCYIQCYHPSLSLWWNVNFRATMKTGFPKGTIKVWYAQQIEYVCVFSPNKQIDEDGGREQEAFGAGVSTDQQNEVTESAEQQHPQHVQLKEQVEAVHPTQH